MCNLRYNQHVKSRIDSVIDGMFELRPGMAVVVVCRADYTIDILTQNPLKIGAALRPTVSDIADAELEAVGVF